MASRTSVCAPPLVDSRRLGERTCVVTVNGRFDALAADPFGRLLAEAVEAGCRDFVFDLCHVHDADASGACALVDAHRHVLPADADVVVAATDHRLLRLLDAVALNLFWPVTRSREQALTALLRRELA